MDAPRIFSMIVAASDNDVIGVENRLPWRLSRDLQQFKKLTMDHHLIMGRKTFESIGRLLPGRTTVVLTRQIKWEFPGCRVAHDLDQLFEIVASDPEPFVVGGAEIYRWLLPWTRRLYLTRVHTILSGDAWLPQIDWEQWHRTGEVSWPSDERNEFAATFSTWEHSSERRSQVL